ncbi:MAG: low-complexity protein [Thiohalocapsa sp.]|jgi:uncharacterized low-complexity protein|uniref:low-complexity protein n=1 Tax=Thiohalocapsa sp. TaxID=2497641 RepID=UPI0025CF6B3D|nr:low-complexity protein [Thiohalocapsa sp.]MCG6942346.1 low-complexity protein [Thiohalocapsa sp.]
MSKKTITPVATIVGAALAGGLSMAHAESTGVSADALFTATQIDGGYMQLAGEGSCGGTKGEGEGKCGDEKDET